MMLPTYMRATSFEYKHRYLVHGLVYTLGLAAPWHPPVWSFLQNGSTWFVASNSSAKPSYQNFATDWNLILAGILVCAIAGAALRIWGAAYLGANTVHQGAMEGDRMVASGPYRYTRNPLYLGTILNTVAVCMLMRPEAAVLTLLLIVIIQFRLIGREEPYLLLHPHGPGNYVRPKWKQGILSEIYVIGCVVSFAVFGWTTGYAWETTILHVMQGIIVALGLSVVARAFMGKVK